MKTAEAPFPFTSMFQNGPRRKGSAPQNLFKPGKDFPPPRTNRAPLPAPGRSEDLPQRRERGPMQSQYHSPFVADYVLPLVGIVEPKSLLTPPRNPKIRAPPVDDVNNLRHDCKCQRRFASTAIQIRRNALFTSPEYAANPERFSVLEPDSPKSSSMIMTCSLAHPSWQARSAKAYWRAVDSGLCSTWPGVDWRT